MLLASTCANIKLWQYCPLGKAQQRRKYLWLLVSLWNFQASHGSSMSSWNKAWVLAVSQKGSLSTCVVPHQMEDGVRLTCGSHRRRSSGLPMICSSPRRGRSGFPSRRSGSFSNPSTPRRPDLAVVPYDACAIPWGLLGAATIHRAASQKGSFLTHFPLPPFTDGFMHLYLCQNPCQNQSAKN